MISRKEFLTAACGLIASSALAACGNNPTIEPQGWTEEERAKGRPEKKQNAGDAAETEEDATIDAEGAELAVAAAGSPYVEILTEFAQPQLEDAGASLRVIEAASSDEANEAVLSGVAIASFCMPHDKFDAYNESNEGAMAAVADIMYWPYGIYSAKHDDLHSVESPQGSAGTEDGEGTEGEGAEGEEGSQTSNGVMSFAIPNSAAERTRALQLMHRQGIIKLSDANAPEATVEDITDNPNQVEIREMEASTLAASLGEVDYAIFDASQKQTAPAQEPEGEQPAENAEAEGDANAESSAAKAKKAANKTYRVADAIAIEPSDCSAAHLYGGTLATKAEAVEDVNVAVLVQALKSPEFLAYLQTTHGQDIVPVA